MLNHQMTDIATRVYNHTFKLDPIIRSLLDTDIYKLLMLQTIWMEYRDVQVTFSLINRTQSIQLAKEIDIEELRDQLNHTRSLRLSKKENIWLAGNTFYGKERLFREDFLSWLRNYSLPEYVLLEKNGQFQIDFNGSWADVTLWEIPALSIVSELRSRAAIRNIGRFELDVLYARAKAKLWEKVIRLKALSDLQIADFGTRRRHGHLWQRWCLAAMKEGLGDSFIGTSNVFMAMSLDLNAIGTNAHELPMVQAALTDSDDGLRMSPYKVLESWQRTYDGNLLIALPDTFGTTGFLNNAPEWVSSWSGFRIDSKDPIHGGEEIIQWWGKMGQDPKQKLLIFSDGLDVDTIENIYHNFSNRVRLSFGWGTHLTNDFRDCAPKMNHQLQAISLVCKVTQANGKTTVKLSDNLTKAIGDSHEIARYKRIFGTKNIGNTSIEV